jgi:hypothetical protein
VNFRDDGYIDSTGEELDFRREEMTGTAAQIAQEIQLRNLREERRSGRELPGRR